MNGLWAIFTVAAAAAQTARNAMQRELTTSLGSVGATHVRFLFGCPFALVFLVVALFAMQARLPATNSTFWLWTIEGALTQIGATALMLLTMRERSFVVSVAYVKTEPLFVAALGLALLNDPLTLPMTGAIVIAVAGVGLISLRPGAIEAGGWKPAALGLSSGALFAVSAIGYRGAILALHIPGYLIPAMVTVAAGITMQAALLTIYLGVADRKVLRAIVSLWRPSLFAGFMGAVASEFWFLSFALATAASVRTLGLVEVLFAQGVSHIVFRQRTTGREAAGIALLVAGAVALVYVGR